MLKHTSQILFCLTVLLSLTACSTILHNVPNQSSSDNLESVSEHSSSDNSSESTQISTAYTDNSSPEESSAVNDFFPDWHQYISLDELGQISVPPALEFFADQMVKLLTRSSSTDYLSHLNLISDSDDLQTLFKENRLTLFAFSSSNEEICDWDNAIPFAFDALVFSVHDSLGIKTLSLDSLRLILNGAITNWSSLGGPDLEIQLCLPQEGSLPSKILEWNDFDCIPSSSVFINTEEGILSVPAVYSPDPGVLCVSSYSHSSDYCSSFGLTPIKINGVMPSSQSILSGDYPLSCTFFGHEDLSALPSDSISLTDWLTSIHGQTLCHYFGLVPLMDIPYTSQIFSYNTGTHYSGDFDSLTAIDLPRGEVFSYAGSRSFLGPDYSYGLTYGLASPDGTALTPPIFNEISPLIWETSNGDLYDPVLKCGKYVLDNNGNPVLRYTLCASDLSWVLPDTVIDAFSGECGIVVFTTDSLLLLDSSNGNTIKRWNYASHRLTNYIDSLIAGTASPYVGQQYRDLCIIGCSPSNSQRLIAFNMNNGSITVYTVRAWNRLPIPRVFSREWTANVTVSGTTFSQNDDSFDLAISTRQLSEGEHRAILFGELILFPDDGYVFGWDSIAIQAPFNGHETIFSQFFGPEGEILLAINDLAANKVFFMSPSGQLLSISVPSNSTFRVSGNVLETVLRYHAVDYDISTDMVIFSTYLGMEP